MRLKLLITVSSLFVVSFLLYSWIRSLPKVLDTQLAEVPITASMGESIFWGKGRCHVCHRIGARGYALRGPNLGHGKEGAPIGVRAQERAEQSGLENASDYLVQSIAEPSAFVVPNYNNEMPEVFKAPIALSPTEIQAVILYLQGLGGTPNLDEITLPHELLAWYRRPVESADSETPGDVAEGRRLFFDSKGPAACATCHIAVNAEGKPEGSTIGPDLSAIASFRTAEHILKKIVKPDSNIVSGYEEELIESKDGHLFVGMVTEKKNGKLILSDKSGATFLIDPDNIATRTTQTGSMMPSNYAELLDQRQLDDLLAYLLSLNGRL